MDKTLKALGQLLSPNQIVTAEARSPVLTSRLQSAFLAEVVLPPVVYPNSVEELRSLMTWANCDKKTILVCGHASKLAWGRPIPATDVVISTAKLDQVIDHAVGDLTITVQTGMHFRALQSQLNAVGQILPIDPAFPDHATLGGIWATRDAGSLRQRYGGVRDLCLGVSFVRADGELAKGGGRVVKNVAGYDLMKLLTGSFGALGVMTEVTLRLYPMQESSQTVVFSGDHEAIATLAAAILDSTLTPVSIDILSQDLLQAVEMTGEVGLAVRVQSLQESVAAQIQRLQDMGTHLLIRHDEADDCIWQGLRETVWAQGEPATLISKVGMLPRSIVPILRTFQQWCEQHSVTLHAQILAGWGIGTLKLSGSTDAIAALVPKLRQHCETHQGYLSILDAPTELRQKFDVWGYPGNAIAPMRKLKDKFDPNHIINPGRFVCGI